MVRAEFTGWQVVTMGAILVPESGLNVREHSHNDHDPKSESFLSVDWGIGQVNDFWWVKALIAAGLLSPDLPVSMQLLRLRPNLRCLRFIFEVALFEGLRIHDGDWELAVQYAYGRWNVYEKGLHKPFLHDARVAAESIGVVL